MTDRMTSSSDRVEIITSVGRRWAAAEKMRIVEETFAGELGGAPERGEPEPTLHLATAGPPKARSPRREPRRRSCPPLTTGRSRTKCASCSAFSVERMNRTLKDATVKRYHYESHDQLRTHLQSLQPRPLAEDPARPHAIRTRPSDSAASTPRCFAPPGRALRRPGGAPAASRGRAGPPSLRALERCILRSGGDAHS